MEDVKTLFTEARNAFTEVKKLTKLTNPVKFVVLYTISRVEFSDALADTESAVSIVSIYIDERL